MKPIIHSTVPNNSRRFLIEQLQLLLNQLESANDITPDFIRTHIASINEHAQGLLNGLPPSDQSKPSPQIAA